MTEPAKHMQLGGNPIDPGSPESRVKWQARWLRDRVFDGVEYRELIDPGRREELNGEIQNVHTLFRREFTLPKAPVGRARLYITADDCYKLYVNGSFVGLGPAPAMPSDYFYNAWDVTEFLRPGANCIGVHTFYQGMHSLTFCSGDNLAGLLVQLEVELESSRERVASSGERGKGSDRGEGVVGGVTGVADSVPPYASPACVTIVSDETWRCCRTDAYSVGHVIGYQTAFSEDIDLRKLPVGWAEAGYDDSGWQRPLVGEIPDIYSLSPQPTPPVDVFNRRPEGIVKKGEGHYFIDFGTELVGETAFLVSGAPGQKVEIRHGEELLEPDTVRYDMRCNCLYQEFCTLSGRNDELLTFFDYKGFRYVEVLNWPDELSPERLWAHERHYPFPEDASNFTSTNPLLNDIWDLCRNGVRVGTIDTYLDCPTREKGGFLGDGFVTGISHLILTGDPRILRKFLKDVANTADYCAGLSSTAPNYINGELAEYSLLWPVLLEYYYQWTADLDFVRDMMPVLAQQLRYFAGYENERGLQQDLYSHATGRYSVLVDWPKNLRDDYDDPCLMGDRKVQEDPEGVVNTMVQGFYHGALLASGRLAAIADCAEVQAFVSGRAERVRKAALAELRDPATGLFVDRNGAQHSALHANVTPLMSGMLPGEEAAPVLELLREKRLSCGVYFSFFVLKALYDAGESDLAYDIMTGTDLHSWHSMLQAGATTCMEAWAPDLKWNTSWCHPWSSAPIHMVAHELMGVRPAAPGWKEIRFAPRIPKNLDSASLRITTPRGPVAVSFEQKGSKITYRLDIPEGCSARCDVPGRAAEVCVAGKHVVESTNASRVGSSG